MTTLRFRFPFSVSLSLPRAPRAAAILAAALLGGCAGVDAGRHPAPTPAPEPPVPAVDPAVTALVARARTAIASAGEGLGREFANRLADEPLAQWLDYFAGKSATHPKWPRPQSVLREIERFTALVEAASSWPVPGTNAIPFAARPPVIDGVLDDAVWRHAASWSGAYPFNETAATGQPTRWRAAWDRDTLYFAFDCADTDIEAPLRGRDGAIFADDAVEIFILPEMRFRTYWEIVVSPAGEVFDSLNCKSLRRWGGDFDPAQDVRGLKHGETVRGTLNRRGDIDEGYTVEVAVPAAELPGFGRGGLQPGDRLRVMLVRTDRSNGAFTPLAFIPLQGWGHNLWNHVTMELAAPDAAASK